MGVFDESVGETPLACALLLGLRWLLLKLRSCTASCQLAAKCDVQSAAAGRSNWVDRCQIASLGPTMLPPAPRPPGVHAAC